MTPCDLAPLSVGFCGPTFAAPELHCAMAHSYLVRVIPGTSRMTWSSGVSPSTSTLRCSAWAYV